MSLKSFKSIGLLATLMTMFDRLLPSVPAVQSPARRRIIKALDVDVTPARKVIPKGCKIFNINGVEVMALNEKNAIRKALKITS